MNNYVQGEAKLEVGKNNFKENKSNTSFSRMPNNIEAEQSVLGSVLLDNEIAGHVISALKEEDFYSEANKKVFLAYISLNNARKPIDSVTLINELERDGEFANIGGMNYITELFNVVPSAVRYKYYVDIVKNLSVLRKIIRASQLVIENTVSSEDKEKALAFAEKQIFDISNETSLSSLENLEATFSEVLQKFEELALGNEKYKATKTGFKDLDAILNGGLHKSDLMIVAARPGVGKTALSLNIVQHIGVDQGKVCAVFSLEMPRIQLAQRIICGRAGVSQEEALKGRLENLHWEKLLLEERNLKESRIFVDDSSLVTPTDILSKCRSLKLKQGRLDVVMVDYIQLMKSGGKTTESRQQEVADISRNLKIIAKELDVPVIALSQLSRGVTNRIGQRPQLSDLRDSGAIEQDADIVMFIHKPEAEGENAVFEPNVVELIIEKHRAGRLGSVKLRWDGATTSFKDYDTVVVEKQETPVQEKVENIETEMKAVTEELDDIF